MIPLPLRSAFSPGTAGHIWPFLHTPSVSSHGPLLKPALVGALKITAAISTEDSRIVEASTAEDVAPKDFLGSLSLRFEFENNLSHRLLTMDRAHLATVVHASFA